MPTAQELIDLLQSTEGADYCFGAEASPKDPGAHTFDCSELVQWACNRLGLEMPDGSVNQYLFCQQHDSLIEVAEGIETPGALLFRLGLKDLGNHVAVSLGRGCTFEARGKDYGVGEFDNAYKRTWTHAALIPGLGYREEGEIV